MNEKIPYQSFTELTVWQAGRKFKNYIYDLVKKFPGEEKYRLTDQLIRASRSINTNIAEGHGRFTYKDQLHFCIQSRGSLSEVQNHVIDALDCGYISQNEFDNVQEKLDEVGKLLNGYIAFLRKNIN